MENPYQRYSETLIQCLSYLNKNLHKKFKPLKDACIEAIGKVLNLRKDKE